MNNTTADMARRFSVAPMMDWTDRHCRMFHRQLTARALLYTEMLTTGAVIHGDRDHLMGFSDAEHPVALQLGGSDEKELAEAARIGEGFGYDEINLNCGCPSDRVQSGRFGACLMAEPDTVARGVEAMRAAVKVPVTVKCRIGIDDQDTEEDFNRFITAVANSGCDTFIVHARKAWLQGLSPKENRDIPPLDYDRVYRLKQARPDLTIVINGGIEDLDDCEQHLARVDGVMLGRAAYQRPWLLADVDRRIFGEAVNPVSSRAGAVEALLPYVEQRLAGGDYLTRITRHMLGLYHGCHGGRHWRRMLSEDARRDGAGIELLREALQLIEQAAATRAAAE
ncbi:MAG: tRNA dihydrouridine(20/20a) synthase DusA [Anderseniella sp.]|nr:tRNA dihydrouridine(20/20a) synthase DusA [Anderseniella sp.]